MDAGRADETADADAGQAVLDARALPTDHTAIDTILGGTSVPHVLWYQPDGTAIAGIDPIAVKEASGTNRFATIRQWGQAVSQRIDYAGPAVARPRFLGGFSFFDEPTGSSPWSTFPAAWFMLPRVQVVATNERSWLTTIGSSPHSEHHITAGVERNGCRSKDAMPSIETIQPDPSKKGWISQVKRVQSAIARGHLRKAVLGHTSEATLSQTASHAAIGSQLEAGHKHCYRFVISPCGDTAFVGASPERLIEADGPRLETDALAGSVARGDVPAADRAFANTLQNSTKDAFEHEVVVDAIRDRLETYCETVETGPRGIRRLASVQHLHTPIEATRNDSHHMLDVASALHPTPAVGGLPRSAALTTLREIETFDRGWYASPVGWFDTDGDGQFAIGIRSAVVEEQTARLFAGAGIVAESDPDAEWDELQLKYQPIRGLFGDK